MKINKPYCKLCGNELIVITEPYCTKCCNEMLQQLEEQDHMVQVTREMAIDAGDRTLEGECIK